ncbi:MAG: DnaA N-terminal domain-containing protein [Bellilinea sp.]
MEQVVQPQAAAIRKPDYLEAWNLVSGQLRGEMSRAQFETWVLPLKPLGYADRVFRLGAVNTFTQEWIESRLKNRVTALLSGMLNETVTLRVVVVNGTNDAKTKMVSAHASADLAAGQTAEALTDPASGVDLLDDEPASTGSGRSSPRKLMLHRAYGSERARVIQPERGMFMTLYFFQQWLPLIGHSAFTVILAARSMCYWNPKTGELRNNIETEMSELAQRAAVSVRTVKDVLNNDLVRRHFLRYTVRRIMTVNGVRTAGILLQVRMDDPLTPADQAETGHDEDGVWYSAEFDDESEP